MKCPKCGYIGFESAQKCRNCGYDFSLLDDPLRELDLPLKEEERPIVPADFDFIASDAPGAVPGQASGVSDADLPRLTEQKPDLPLFTASAATVQAAPSRPAQPVAASAPTARPSAPAPVVPAPPPVSPAQPAAAAAQPSVAPPQTSSPLRPASPARPASPVRPAATAASGPAAERPASPLDAPWVPRLSTSTSTTLPPARPVPAATGQGGERREPAAPAEAARPVAGAPAPPAYTAPAPAAPAPAAPAPVAGAPAGAPVSPAPSRSAAGPQVAPAAPIARPAAVAPSRPAPVVAAPAVERPAPPTSPSPAPASRTPASASRARLFDLQDAKLDLEPEATRPVRPTPFTTAGQPGGPVARALAAAVDAVLLAALNAGVVYFTLRVCRLSFDDLAVLPVVPLVAFFALLDGGYLVAFTAFGGQTIGKMATGLRVVTEEGGRVAASQALIRTTAYLASLIPAGLGFVFGLFGPSHRALHDRLAGTRVVQS